MLDVRCVCQPLENLREFTVKLHFTGFYPVLGGKEAVSKCTPLVFRKVNFSNLKG